MEAEPAAIFDSGHSASNIPIELDASSKVYLRGKINNSLEVRILLDTGAATMFAMDRQHAESLNLTLTEGYQVQGSGANRSAAALAKDISVRLPGITLVHIDAVAVSLYRPDQNGESYAILGFEFFKNFVVEIDYDNRLANIYDSQGYGVETLREHESTRPDTELQAIPVTTIANLPYVTARVTFPGSEPIEAQFHLDSGSSIAVQFYFGFVTEQRLMKQLTNAWPGSAVGEGGEIRTAFALAESIELGPLKLWSQTVGLEAEQGGSLASTIAVGSIGAPILHTTKTTFDVPHNRIFVAKRVAT
jgi:predicted aspartyl protease